MKIKITSDSTCDLSAEQLAKYGISVLPLIVTLGDKSHYDGVNFTPQDIYDYAEKTKKLPKTAARSAEDFKDFFKGFFDSGYTDIVHFSISSELSACCQSATIAASELKGVRVVDCRSLSSGTALVALYATELVKEGKTADEVYKLSAARVPAVQASFVVDNMEYLYKGGRCSSVQLMAGKMLKIKPVLMLTEGKITVGRKFMGNMTGSALKYVDEILEKFPTPDLKRIFVTRTVVDSAIIDAVKEHIAERFKFAEIIDCIAGATITSHCGKGTFGILYLNDGK